MELARGHHFLEGMDAEIASLLNHLRNKCIVRPVWVHFLGLCFEDIKPSIIRSLGRALGLVINIDFVRPLIKALVLGLKPWWNIDLREERVEEFFLDSKVGNCVVRP